MSKQYTAEEKKAFARKMAFKRGLMAGKGYYPKKSVAYTPRKTYEKKWKTGTGEYLTQKEIDRRREMAETPTYPKEIPTGRLITRNATGGYGAYFPKRNTMYGHGTYKKRAYKGYGAYENVGEQLGSGIGGFLGKNAQKLLMSLGGFGEYKIQDNSLFQGGMRPPEIVNAVKMENAVVVRHSEYINDILGTEVFTVNEYPLQPALPETQGGTFAWLHRIASCFEQYRFQGVVFEYRTTVSDFLVGSGTVIMGTEYDTEGDDVFPDKRTMENHEYSNSAKASIERFYHPIECKRSLTTITNLFTRTAEVPDGADKRLYDLGLFQIATYGLPTAMIGEAVGELWVSYEVCFFKIKMPPTIAQESETDHYQLTGGLNGANPLGTSSTLVAGSNARTSINHTTVVVSFDPDQESGHYLVVWTVKGNSTALVAPALTFTNCSLISVWYNDLANNATTPSITSTTQIACFVVKITALLATMTWGVAGTVPSTYSGADLWITRINSDILTNEFIEEKKEGIIKHIGTIYDNDTFPNDDKIFANNNEEELRAKIAELNKKVEEMRCITPTFKK